MIARNTQVFTLLALSFAGAFCSVGLGQEGEPDGNTAAEFDEEVVVRGRSHAFLRQQFQLAEEAVYARFNEINSNDEFDIHCRREAVTGSRILRRTCQANFWREAQANAGTETVRAMQGGAAIPAEVFLGEALQKRRLLEQEMRQLASEDEELLRALVRLANAAAAMERRAAPVAASDATAARERGAEGGALPYDAARVVDVRVGRESWQHALTSRTFTIAQVHGEISSMRVDCDGGAAPLEWEVGAEWTLPDDWEACTLRVAAARGTSFALYEFD
jgi:hypothetical protein